MRGGNAEALSKWESVWAEPPLTLTLSPLRGEGTRRASAEIPKCAAAFDSCVVNSERGSGSRSAWAVFGVLRVIDPRSRAP